ncbi:MAG TPA: UDP-2,3-diacylglucosamine diphosphatase LpxI [Caulobacteraceae bacterium]|nr:UDP-2,3-diacylglucosamine diphosphatase LpxI [Caulobacteraceae bacterium]
MKKLGLIAGGGALPVSLAGHCDSAGRPCFVVRLKGFAGPELNRYPGADVGIAELGKGIRVLKEAGCQAICMAGHVARPDFRKLRPDLRGLAALPGVIMAARKGDDGLLRFLVREFEKEGFEVEGAHQVMGALTLAEGPLGRYAPGEAHGVDIARAMEVARAIGALDVGQGAVSCEGLVLAVEAQEGTDGMLRRIMELPEAIRGVPGRPRGVLAKACKPGQETRVDLPTIGVATLQRCARAGIAGIVGEAGRLLVLDRDRVVEVADQLGLFVFGLPPQEP